MYIAVVVNNQRFKLIDLSNIDFILIAERLVLILEKLAVDFICLGGLN